MINTKASQIIDLYRFPLAVLVVFIHYLGGGDLEYSALCLSEVSGYDVYCFIRILFSRVISQIAVPGFFLISGFLFFQSLESWNWHIWRNKIKKRIQTLLIPYILWITLYVLYGRVLYIVKNGITDGNGIMNILFSKWFIIGSYYNCILADSTNVSWIGTVNPTCCPVLIPFWFIRDLMFMVVLSPIIFIALKRIGKLYLFILLLAYVSSIWPVIPGISIRALCFFSLGGYFAMHICTIPKMVMKLSYIPTIILAVICSLFYHSYLYSFFLPWFVLFACLFLWFLGENLVKNRIKMPIFLVKSTFFIFAFHFFVIDSLQLFPIFDGQSSTGMILLYFAVPIIIVSISVSLYCLLNKECPKITRFLVGR